MWTNLVKMLCDFALLCRFPGKPFGALGMLWDTCTPPSTSSSESQSEILVSLQNFPSQGLTNQSLHLFLATPLTTVEHTNVHCQKQAFKTNPCSVIHIVPWLPVPHVPMCKCRRKYAQTSIWHTDGSVHFYSMNCFYKVGFFTLVHFIALLHVKQTLCLHFSFMAISETGVIVILMISNVFRLNFN